MLARFGPGERRRMGDDDLLGGVTQRVAYLEDTAAIVLHRGQRQLDLSVMIAVKYFGVGKTQTRHADHRAQLTLIDKRLYGCLHTIQIVQCFLELGFRGHVDIDVNDAERIVREEIDFHAIGRYRDDGQHEHRERRCEKRQRTPKHVTERLRVLNAQLVRPATAPA